MLCELAARNRARFPLRACVSGDGGRWTYGDVYELATQFAQGLSLRGVCRVGVHLSDSKELIAAFIALDMLRVQAYLFDRERSTEHVRALCKEQAVPLCLTDDTSDDEPPFVHVARIPSAVILSRPTHGATPGQVVLWTSGTTGTPKSAVHTWRSLLGPLREHERFYGSRWMLLFALTRFAGIEVFLQAFVNGGCVTILNDRSMSRIVEHLGKEQITHISATPAFWWKLLLETMPEQRKGLSLAQITLGGEWASQPLLTALRQAFPSARITHTYASTEAGLCFAASDGLEGYPVESIERNPRGVHVQIVDEELWIASPHAMQADVTGERAPRGWVPTGDVVAWRDGRLMIVGRKAGCIQVAGYKFYPAEVEREIRQVPGVLEVWVCGVPSSIVGQVVQAHVVPEPGRSIDELRCSILRHCATTLPRHHMPHLMTFVSEIPMAASGKAVGRHG